VFAATKARDSGYSISFHSSIPRRALTIVKMPFRHPCASTVACERFWLSTLKLSLLSNAASTPLHLAGGPEDEAELHRTQLTPATRSCREFRAHKGPDHELRSGKWGEIVLSIAFDLNDLLRTTLRHCQESKPLPAEETTGAQVDGVRLEVFGEFQT
jgi:hypothetical protein